MISKKIWMVACLLCAPYAVALEDSQGVGIFTELGASADFETMQAVKEAGGSFITVSTVNFICPDEPEEKFDVNVEKVRAAGVRVMACNTFLVPERHTVVGPKPKHDEIVEWADIVCRRMAKAGGKFVVLGSAKARRIPEGWSKEQADGQFVALLKRLGLVAQKHGVTIVVEQLRKEECNFINRIDHLGELIRKADHPHVKALADLYHMARGGDMAEDLKRNLDVVVHMEIAEKEERTYPGNKGDDFRPYFRALAEAGWKGAMSIEGRGKPTEFAGAFQEIRQQEADVGGKL